MKYRIIMRKNFALESEHCQEFINYYTNYDKIETTYILQRKRQFWWGWTHVYSSKDKNELYKRMKNLRSMETWEDKVIETIDYSNKNNEM